MKKKNNELTLENRKKWTFKEWLKFLWGFIFEFLKNGFTY